MINCWTTDSCTEPCEKRDYKSSEMAGETLQKLISLVKGETNEQLEEVLEQGHDVGKLTEQINEYLTNMFFSWFPDREADYSDSRA